MTCCADRRNWRRQLRHMYRGTAAKAKEPLHRHDQFEGSSLQRIVTGQQAFAHARSRAVHLDSAMLSHRGIRARGQAKQLARIQHSLSRPNRTGVNCERTFRLNNAHCESQGSNSSKKDVRCCKSCREAKFAASPACIAFSTPYRRRSCGWPFELSCLLSRFCVLSGGGTVTVTVTGDCSRKSSRASAGIRTCCPRVTP